MNHRRDFFDIQSFLVYYGSNLQERFKAFDAVILEPKGHTKEQIRALREKGVIVLAYFSVVELPVYHEEFKSLQEGFLQVNQKPIFNDMFDTYHMDLNSQRWRSHLLGQAAFLLDEQGYDGLFLDTVGDLENPLLRGGAMFEQILAYVELLQRIKERYPLCIYVQNNGIEHVASYSKETIQGICWENPSFEKQHRSWSNMVLRKLKTLQKEHHIKVFLLTDGTVDGKHIVKTAKRNNMLYYIANKDYLDIY